MVQKAGRRTQRYRCRLQLCVPLLSTVTLDRDTGSPRGSSKARNLLAAFALKVSRSSGMRVSPGRSGRSLHTIVFVLWSAHARAFLAGGTRTLVSDFNKSFPYRFGQSASKP